MAYDAILNGIWQLIINYQVAYDALTQNKCHMANVEIIVHVQQIIETNEDKISIYTNDNQQRYKTRLNLYKRCGTGGGKEDNKNAPFNMLRKVHLIYILSRNFH